MARKRCRERGATPTWRKNDVGTEAVSRHGTSKNLQSFSALEVLLSDLLFICRLSSLHEESKSECR